MVAARKGLDCLDFECSTSCFLAFKQRNIRRSISRRGQFFALGFPLHGGSYDDSLKSKTNQLQSCREMLVTACRCLAGKNSLSFETLHQFFEAAAGMARGLMSGLKHIETTYIKCSIASTSCHFRNRTSTLRQFQLSSRRRSGDVARGKREKRKAFGHFVGL